MAKNPAIQRNIRLYPWYAASLNAFFWLPVVILYFSQQVSLAGAITLEAIYYGAVALLEVPSGYFSDRFGRKPTLLISAGALLLGYLIFFGASFVGQGPSVIFGLFALAQIFVAVGLSFNSGTDASFHYDSLVALGLEDEFGQREAMVARNSFIATAVAVLIGGAVGELDLRWAYALAALAGGTGFILVLNFVEPVDHTDGELEKRGFLLQLRYCVGQLRQRSLKWLFIFAVFMTVLNHIPYTFYQPYIGLAAGPLQSPTPNATDSSPGLITIVLSWFQSKPALISGVHTSLTMLAGAWFASQSNRLRKRVGTGMTLMLSALMQALIIGFMAWTLHWGIVLLVLLRSCPRGLMTAPLNEAVTPRIPKDLRATYLSMQSLVGRLAFAVFLGGLSIFLNKINPDGELQWQSVAFSLRIGAVIAVVGLIFLALTLRWCVGNRREDDTHDPNQAKA